MICPAYFQFREYSHMFKITIKTKADTVLHRCPRPGHTLLGNERLPKSQLTGALVTVILIGHVVGSSGAGLCGNSGGGGRRSCSATLSAGAAYRHTRRVGGARSNTLAAITCPTSCPRRVAPTLTTGNRCPAVRLVRIEIFNRWGAGVVAYSVIRAVEVKRQWRVV